jgi:hypothetical protein
MTQQEKFSAFLESIKTPANAEVIGSIQSGYDAIYEGIASRMVGAGLIGGMFAAHASTPEQVQIPGKELNKFVASFANQAGPDADKDMAAIVIGASVLGGNNEVVTQGLGNVAKDAAADEDLQETVLNIGDNIGNVQGNAVKGERLPQPIYSDIQPDEKTAIDQARERLNMAVENGSVTPDKAQKLSQMDVKTVQIGKTKFYWAYPSGTDEVAAARGMVNNTTR